MRFDFDLLSSEAALAVFGPRGWRRQSLAYPLDWPKKIAMAVPVLFAAVCQKN